MTTLRDDPWFPVPSAPPARGKHAAPDAAAPTATAWPERPPGAAPADVDDLFGAPYVSQTGDWQRSPTTPGGAHAAPVVEAPAEVAAEVAAADELWPDLRPAHRTPAWRDDATDGPDDVFGPDYHSALRTGLPSGLDRGTGKPGDLGPLDTDLDPAYVAPATAPTRATRRQTGRRADRSARGRSARPVLVGVLGLVLGLAVSCGVLAVAWVAFFGPV